ncbi:MAG TPA: sigma-54 dependent transcriptional regulator [Candidatus Limnocylindrales bacterium]|nr:sigma-54 dependent transcriptional regulator [Candidatus Limnocylindrales bacterium]
MKLRVRIADDEELIRKSLTKLLAAEGYQVDSVASAAEVLESVRRDPPHVLVLDLRLPDGSGLDLLPRLHSLSPDLKVVVITAFGDLPTAVEAMRRGATDFLKKPYEMEEVLLAMERLKAGVIRETQLDAFRRGELEAFVKTRIVSESPAMGRVWDMTAKVAQSEGTTVLIEGESGTGKELVARAIHFESGRREAPFLAVNCSSFQEQLLENELFGHERGAFTDAREAKRGLVELADEGTLFLDEVGDLPAATQAKFLRFIEDRTFKRVGGSSDLAVDLRVVAATNRDLEQMVKEGKFRQDLYYRLKVVSILLPPLRERGDDVLLLARHFLSSYNEKFRKNFLSLTPEVEGIFRAYRWPGNVRELKNLLERVVLLENDEALREDHLPAEVTAQAESLPRVLRDALAARAEGDGEMTTLAEIEQEHILKVLEFTQGNRSHASRILGISRQSLIERLKRIAATRGSLSSI